MTKRPEFHARDHAINMAARKGLSWPEQALAGLAALPKDTRGPGNRFTYLLTCASSPLPELSPSETWRWTHVFIKALKIRVLEKTGRIIKVHDRLAGKRKGGRHYKPEYRMYDKDRSITVYVDPATEAEYVCKLLKESLNLLPRAITFEVAQGRAKIEEAIFRLAPFIDA